MPLWYSSIAREHAAVREAAGIFDCTHMGVLEISGSRAAEFMDQLTTNAVTNLDVMQARYSFVLDTSGNVLDDLIVFRKGPDNFILVVNAANNDKIKNWINALLDGEVCIDPQDSRRRVCARPKMRDLRAAECGHDCRVDIALQGPKSLEVLLALVRDEQTNSQISDLRPFRFMEANVADIECLVSRTGYTGAKIGFELFVNPEKASALWETILHVGQPLGLLPCGLGTRDSLRVEAGFPLYGHELAGKFGISPFETGYGWAVKLEKEFFIGKAAMEQVSGKHDMKVARVRCRRTKGSRPVRPDDGVLDKHGRCIGWVSSSTIIGEKQIALVYGEAESLVENDIVGIYYVARSQRQIEKGRKQNVEKAELLEPDLTGRVASRFAKF
jgi:glycine hydroxymethyltransferase